MNRCSNSSSVGTSLFSCAPWRARKRSRSSPQRFATWTERGTSPSRGSAYRRAAVREDPLRGTPSWTLPRSAATERALQRRERSRLPAPSFDPECREQAGRGVRRDDAWLQRGEPALGPRAAAATEDVMASFLARTVRLNELYLALAERYRPAQAPFVWIAASATELSWQELNFRTARIEERRLAPDATIELPAATSSASSVAAPNGPGRERRGRARSPSCKGSAAFRQLAATTSWGSAGGARAGVLASSARPQSSATALPSRCGFGESPPARGARSASVGGNCGGRPGEYSIPSPLPAASVGVRLAHYHIRPRRQAQGGALGLPAGNTRECL